MYHIIRLPQSKLFLLNPKLLSLVFASLNCHVSYPFPIPDLPRNVMFLNLLDNLHSWSTFKKSSFFFKVQFSEKSHWFHLFRASLRDWAENNMPNILPTFTE